MSKSPPRPPFSKGEKTFSSNKGTSLQKENTDRSLSNKKENASRTSSNEKENIPKSAPLKKEHPTKGSPLKKESAQNSPFEKAGQGGFTLLSIALANNNYALPNTIQQKLIQYLELLQRWNKVFNLTAIRDPEDMVWLHILDSLSVSPHLHGSRILDVGTGAGLPGIPLALIHPDKQFVLLDSNSKKTRFLTQTILELGLKNVEVVHARCEDFSAPQGFDSIISRAFSSIAVMLVSTQHLINNDGQFLAMKGVYPEQELQDIPENFILLDVHKLIIKGLAAERHVVCIRRK